MKYTNTLHSNIDSNGHSVLTNFSFLNEGVAVTTTIGGSVKGLIVCSEIRQEDNFIKELKSHFTRVGDEYSKCWQHIQKDKND